MRTVYPSADPKWRVPTHDDFRWPVKFASGYSLALYMQGVSSYFVMF